MTVSASIVPAPGNSHSGALSRRNRHAGRSSSGVSSTGAVGSPSTNADRVDDAGEHAVDDRRARRIVGSKAVDDLGARAVEVVRASRPVAPGRRADHRPERGQVVGVRLAR